MAITVDAIEYPPGSGTYQSIGISTDYQGMFIDDSPYGGLGGLLIERSIPGRSSQFDGLNISSRTLPLTLARKGSGSVTAADFNSNVVQWFAPGARDSSGKTTRFLRCLWHDGSTQIRIPVNVVSIQLRARHIDVYDIVVQATWPYFEAMTADTPGTMGTTIAQGGNVNAPVLLTVTYTAGGTPSNYARFSITETAGIGATEVPVLLDWGSAAISTPSQWYCFDQDGVNRPFEVASSRYLWTTVSMGPNETVNYHLAGDSTFSNPLADTLEWGEFYIANSSNASQEQDGFLLSTNPARNGLWFPQRLAFTGGGANAWGYEITEGATDCVFTIRDAGSKAKNDSNGMVIVTGIPADSITGLSRVTANHTTDIRSIVRYRQAGQASWTDTSYSETTSTTVTTTITLVDAVEIACNIEVTGDTPTDGATLTLSGTGTPDITVNLDTAQDFTVTKNVSVATDVALLDGTITNSTTGQVITFDDLMVYDAVSGASRILYLDFTHNAAKRIYSADTTNGIILGKEGSISFSDPVAGMHMAPGDNTTAETLTGAVTATFRDTYG